MVALLHLNLGNNFDLFAWLIGKETTPNRWIRHIQNIILDFNSFVLVVHQIIAGNVQ
jgi:hypothetical protein